MQMLETLLNREGGQWENMGNRKKGEKEEEGDKRGWGMGGKEE